MFGSGYRGFESEPEKPEDVTSSTEVGGDSEQREREICEMIVQSFVLSLAAYAGVGAFVVSLIVKSAEEPEASFFLSFQISQLLASTTRIECDGKRRACERA